MQDASRVERLWLAMAVTLVWTVRLGSQVDSQLPVADVEGWPPGHIARQRVKAAPNWRHARRLSCPQRGHLLLLAALVRAEDWPVGAIVAEPWPVCVMPLKRVVSSTKLWQQAQKQARKRRYKAAHCRERAA